MAGQKTYKAAVYMRFGSAEQITSNRITALYCRAAQADNAVVEIQAQTLKRFADDNGYKNQVCYTDNGASGLTLDRPAMNSLLSDIRNGKVGTVITQDFARIARDYRLIQEFENTARKYGTILITIQGGELKPNLFDDILRVIQQKAFA